MTSSDKLLAIVLISVATVISIAIIAGVVANIAHPSTPVQEAITNCSNTNTFVADLGPNNTVTCHK